jgi:hypothetical protein
LAWLPAVAAEQPVRGELEAVMVEQAPRLDGTLDDPLWQKCPPLLLGGCGQDGPLEPRTEARVLFGPTTVFIDRPGRPRARLIGCAASPRVMP